MPDYSDKRTEMSPLLGEGEEWEYGTTVDEEASKDLQIQNSTNQLVEYKKSLNTLASSRTFADGVLIINDVFLYGVPTTSIRIDKPTDVSVNETIRTASPIVSSHGRQTPELYLTLLFASDKESLDQLHRLISVLRRHPFTFIHNNYIAEEIGLNEFESTIFVLEAGTLRSTADTVDVIALDLNFKLFNYKPFSNHHWYSGKLFQQNSQSENVDTSLLIQNPLDMQGYSSDEYSVSTKTEEQRSSATKKALFDSIAGDAPVVLPSESSAWMMYADRLCSPDLTPPIINEEPSDYIGFSVRAFEYLSPPGSARAGKGDLNYWYNNNNSDLRPHLYPWAKDQGSSNLQTDQERQVERIINGSDQESITIDSTGLATYKAYRGRKTKTTQIDTNTALWLGRMIIGEGGGSPSNTKVAALLWGILNRWGIYYRNKSLIQTIRAFSQPVNPRWARGGDLAIQAANKGGRYTEAVTEGRLERRARISTLSWSQIPNRVRKLINRLRRGTLLPPEKFKTISRSTITNWGSIKGLDWRKRLTRIGDQYIDIAGDRFFQDVGFSGRVEIIPPINNKVDLATPNELDLNEAQKELQKKQARLREAEDNTADKERALDSAVKATKIAREAWINHEVNVNNRYYYGDDPNIRNVFYTSNEIHISGDFRQQLGLTVAPNIACSAMSISFGHRLAQIKLAGQSTSTFQFLGAGNRTGQMVFQFAGDQGRESALHLKEIIETARRNAQQFSHEIPEAGSVKIHSYNSFSGEQNLILSLLGIEDVVITNIQDSIDPESPDKHQLVIEFIAQEFGKEKYDRKFEESFDAKKQIIRSVMRYVTYRQQSKSDKRIFRPEESIAIYNQGAGREYEVKGDTPSWFASLVARATTVCNEINDNIPPTKWKRGENTSEDWVSAYDDFGAGDKIIGRVKNVHLTEVNTGGLREGAITGPLQALSAITGDAGFAAIATTRENVPEELKGANIADMYNGIFQFNGGLQTNDIHVDLFRKFTNAINEIAVDAQQYIKDEENFEYYFGSIGKEILGTVTTTLNECYDDMELPNIPGTELRLPPEFYLYDDSNEDPMIAEATNTENMELLLEEHVKNEIASIQHYMEKAWLGGSYVSKNLPRILEARQLQEQNINVELTYFSTWFNLFIEGGQPWEPLKHRYTEAIDSGSGFGKWFNETQKQMGASTDAEMRLKYMDNLIRLSGYLHEDRHWSKGSIDESPLARQALVESVYGEDWNNVSFGPNPLFANADSATMGHIESESTLNARRIQEEQISASSLNRASDTQELSGFRTVRGDNVVTVGNLKEEEAEVNIADSLNTSLEILSYITPLFNAIDNTIDTVGQVVNAGQRFFSTLENILIMKHPLLNKIQEGDSTKNIAKIGTSIALGTKKNDISMRRAFPTFRIYFIEDDSEDTELHGKTIKRAFDDFYSYSAVQEIKIHRSRKIAADLATIRMTNVTGKLFRRRFGQKDKTQEELRQQEQQGIFAETDKEHPFEKMVLQDGVKVQIRLGNASNPDDLETVFLGRIVEIAPAVDGKIIELMIQGCGVELESVQLGPFEDGPVFYSTQQALSGAIIQDSIVSFGRKSKFNRINPAEIRNAWTGGQGSNFLSNINPAHILENWSNYKMDQQLSQYSFLNYPQDDNIFAPSPEIYATAWDKFWNNACSYRPLNQTPWQIFKEHELRHPGYCALAVPYGHSPRMTMFFGAKSQHYWARPPSPLELFMSEANYNTMIKFRHAANNNAKDAIALNQKFRELESASPELAQALISDLMSTSQPNKVLTELGKQFGRYVPFRNFHYLDDKHHIIQNNIRTSVDDTYNQVTVLYFENENSLDDDTEELSENISNMVAESDGVFSVKLDENIPDQYLRSFKDAFPSCVTVDMAKRYASGLLARHLKDCYKGRITTLGDPTIKPYSICQINDQSINMTGPIEVEEVTHILSRETGFISIIKPDMCVDVNDMYSASVYDVAAAGSAMMWGGFDLGAITGFSTLALMAGVKFASWTQDGNPIVATTLSLGGRPFVSATIGANETSLITQIHGKWRQYWDDVDDAWDKLDIGEALFDKKIGMQDTLFNIFGTGFNGGIEPVGGE